VRRPRPSEDQLQWRRGYLAALRWLTPDVNNDPPGLERGNVKTGTSGTLFSTVLIWNLPSVATCPGASPWCLTGCYTADERADVFPVSTWRSNWGAFFSAPDRLASAILRQLDTATPDVAVRIHSSGDFFSVDYVEWWNSIVRARPAVSFWAYTRSWAVPALREALEKLRSESNVQLFASWDDSMPLPPNEWRLALVDRAMTSRTGHLSCPEEQPNGPQCASCGFCISPDERDVLFHLH
jgi:hypothetical protein